MTLKITKYNSEINYMQLGKLNSTEMNLFFTILTKARFSSEPKIKIKLDELKKMANIKHRNPVRLKREIRRIYLKLLTLTSYKGSLEKEQYSDFVLFSKFSFNVSGSGTPYLEVEITSDAMPLLTDVHQGFTRYSLNEFVSIKSKYAKTLFRLLKQFRTTGKLSLSKEKFHTLLAVPKSYKESNINKNILYPALEQLLPFFENLKVKKKHLNTKGKPVNMYIFTFKKQQRNSNDLSTKKSSEKMNGNSNSEDFKIKNKELTKYLSDIDKISTSVIL